MPLFQCSNLIGSLARIGQSTKSEDLDHKELRVGGAQARAFLFFMVLNGLAEAYWSDWTE